MRTAAIFVAKRRRKVAPSDIGVKEVYSTLEMQVAVAFLIFANFITSIAEKQLWPSGNDKVPNGPFYRRVFGGLELFYNVSFSVELAMNLYAHWFLPFWQSGWNIFDFVTVAISWLFQFDLPLPGPLRLMRMVRALRVFRLFKRVKSLRKILESLARAVPGVVNAFVIMLIVMCIYAIVAVDFFRTQGTDGQMHFEWCRSSIPADRRSVVVFNSTTRQWQEDQLTECPPYFTARNNDFGNEYFGNFFKALYTMFQVLTGDSWSEAVGRPLIANWGPAATGLYFVSFYLLHAVVLINVVVAVLLEKMVEESDDEDNEDRRRGRFAAYNRRSYSLRESSTRSQRGRKKSNSSLLAAIDDLRASINDLRQTQDRILCLLEDRSPRDDPLGDGSNSGDDPPAT